MKLTEHTSRLWNPLSVPSVELRGHLPSSTNLKLSRTSRGTSKCWLRSPESGLSTQMMVLATKIRRSDFWLISRLIKVTDSYSLARLFLAFWRAFSLDLSLSFLFHIRILSSQHQTLLWWLHSSESNISLPAVNQDKVIDTTNGTQWTDNWVSC